MRSLLIAITMVVFSPFGAFASCSDILVDQLSATHDKAAVTAAARELGNLGYEVRVRAISSRRGAKNIDEFEQAYRATCPEWLIGGTLRSSVLLMLYVDNRTSAPWLGVYYGSGLAKLDKEYRGILAERFIPRIQDFRDGDKKALTPAFVETLRGFKDVMERPAGNAPVVIKTGPSVNYTGAIVTIAFILLAGFGVVLFFRYRSDMGDTGAAMAEAHRARSACLNRLLAITDSDKFAELDALADAAGDKGTEARRLITDLKGHGTRATAAFNRFDNTEKDDPNKKGLSETVYRNNQQAYEDIIATQIEPAETILANVNELLGAHHKSRAA
ncbi:MAG: hypothetical protein KBD06_05545 [Candidatus Pacebacteria bacterium]|nr:hypothetical protein [Candidatus Paceibacterota bacterium]